MMIGEPHGALRARAATMVGMSIPASARLVVAADADRLHAVAALDERRTLSALAHAPAGDAALAALLATLRDGGVSEAVLRDHAGSRAQHAHLEAAGFALVAETVVVRRSLVDPPRARRAWKLRRATDRELRALVGRVLSGTRSRYVGSVDALFDAPAAERRTWAAAELDGDTVGVVLARPHGDAGVTMSLIGLVPEHRGRGLSADLLAHALATAAARGARWYVDETDLTDEPAQRMLRAAGCEPIALRRLYRSQP